MPVAPGQAFELSVWAQAGDDLTACALGVDPAGGTNADGAVTWSSASTDMTWVQKTVTGSATGNYITIFLKVTSADNVERNGFFDDVAPAAMPRQPRLFAEHSGNSLALTWPECPSARLEQAASLSTPISWKAVTNQATVGGGQKSVMFTPTTGVCFFRLVLE